MKQSIAVYWAESLRSGKYKKGRGYLNRGDGRFCALGVLCDISKLGEWIPVDNLNKVTYGSGNRIWCVFQCMDETMHGTIPKAVREWSDIRNAGEIIKLNEKAETTFSDIADYIEKNWETL